MSTLDLAVSPGDLRSLAEQSNAWPFEQARQLVARLKKKPKDEVLFETGYGPSGLPHIGTFGEVARTTMVRHAFRVLTEDRIKTRLLAFSDDMDGLRKVPDNVPNKELLEKHLGEPLTRVPDPFGTHPSFGAHNNARLRAFLDTFGFDYEFASATDYYVSGKFDATLLRVLERIDQVMAVMLPSLREERAASYSPFLPICPRTGVVLYVPITAHDVKSGTISYVDPETKEPVTLPVTGGHCKLQWKPDWAMRWVALGVDYEMAGKDLIDSVKLSGKICSALGGVPPEGFNYELFLDEHGQKISKSKGNGLTIDEWLRYASPESLSLFMYREPKAAKRLHFDVIPRNVDDYQQFLDGFPRQDAKQQLANPVWHIHAGHPPTADMPVTFQLLLTLVSSSNAENAATLWGFIGRYRPGVTPQTHPKLDAMVGYAINYYRDFVAPTKKFREPTPTERAALQDLRDALSQLPPASSAEEIQNVVYEIGRREPFLDAVKKGKDGRPGVSLDWFNMLYQVLLGQEKGPRFGSFVAVYGLANAVTMIDGALARSRVVSMDTFLLRNFQQQVALQCKFVLASAEDLKKGVAESNSEQIFYALQNLLNASANISKALWGARGKMANERRLLRDSIGIGDDSPLREVNMRNNFEHFDERLDRWWAQSTRHNFIDMSIGSPNAFGGAADLDRFRIFDPATTNMTFWGEEFNIQSIVNEVKRIVPRLQQEVIKPHFDPK
jgi:lysyl-tRNA synthetase class 1